MRYTIFPTLYIYVICRMAAKHQLFSVKSYRSYHRLRLIGSTLIQRLTQQLHKANSPDFVVLRSNQSHSASEPLTRHVTLNVPDICDLRYVTILAVTASASRGQERVWRHLFKYLYLQLHARYLSLLSEICAARVPPRAFLPIFRDP